MSATGIGVALFAFGIMVGIMAVSGLCILVSTIYKYINK